MDNSRNAPRQRCVLKAEITFANGAFRQECLVRDVSETGARLMLKDGVNLPAEFGISLPNRSEVSRAIVRWRRDGQVGIEFLRSVASAAQSGTPQSLEERLEAALVENARLSRTIAELNETVAAMKKHLTRFTYEEAVRAS